MASTRATSGDDGAELLGAAAALRWSRPDLSAAIADHVMRIARADVDGTSWLRAAGWAVHARSATGDGRECASDILDGLVERGTHLLDHPAADRLRVELAVVAAGAGRTSAARTLLTPVTVADTTPELRADALCALARCATADRPSSVHGLIQRVEATWAEVGGRRGDVGAAVAALVVAAAERRAGRASAAVGRAAAGLACLERAQGGRPDAPSRHVVAGLTAEWLSGLLEAGRVEEAREGCVSLEPLLRDPAPPSRQIALLRLTVARTLATTDADPAAEALRQAARDAAGSDAQDLESVCWSALAALQEQAGRVGEAHESLRHGLDAQQRDARRGARFCAVLDAVVPPAYADHADHADLVGGDAAVFAGAAHNGDGNSYGNGHRTSNGHGPDRHGSAEAGPAHAADAAAHDVAAAAHGAAAHHADHDDYSTGEPWTDWSAAIARDRPPQDLQPLTTAVDAGRREEGGPAAAEPDAPPARENGRARHPLDVDDRRSAARGADPVSGLAHGSGSPAGDPWQGWTDESPIGHFLARSRQRADEIEQAGREAGRAEPLPHVVIEPDLPAPVTAVPDPEPPARPSNPWSTGSWSAVGWGRAPRSAGWVPSDAAAQRPGSGGRRRRADPDDAVAPQLHEPAAVDVVTGRGAEGCVVIVDLARDGRRFAGRRAGAVVRAVADQLNGHAPAGARLRHDDADALSVVLPGWSRSAATEWMHSTLPGVFEKVVTADDLPGTRLRAAVHDVDGPVGAQLLQQLDTGDVREERPGRHGAAAGAPSRFEDAGPPPAGGGRRRRRREDMEAVPEPAEQADALGSTDGLGIADLLAGALAAYRSI